MKQRQRIDTQNDVFFLKCISDLNYANFFLGVSLGGSEKTWKNLYEFVKNPLALPFMAMKMAKLNGCDPNHVSTMSWEPILQVFGWCPDHELPLLT